MTTCTVQFTIERSLCQDVLASAIEAGTHGSFWLRDYDSNAHRSSLDGVYNWLRVGAPLPNTESTEQPIRRRITPEVIAQAIGAALSMEATAWAAAQILAGNCDGPSADVILQLAVFGRVVYA